jgi:hypothetical protein
MMTVAGRYAEEGQMGGKIRSAISNGQLGRSIVGTAAALSASAALVMTPTKASAFDISGMIGTAMAIQMQMHGYRGISGGYGHARSRGEAHSDNGSDDHSSGGGGERDASALDAVDRSARSDNRLAMHREIRGPSSTSGGLAQASERDAAADQAPGSGRAFDDQPAFKPAR